jgi:hypothetical protein
MKLFNGLIIRSFLNPLLVFRALKDDEKNKTLFCVLTSLLIYLVGYFTFVSIFLGKVFFQAGTTFMLMGIIFVIIVSFFKVFLYTFILSQRTENFVSYKEILFINTLGNIKILVFYLLIVALSPFLSQGVSFFLLFLVCVHSLFIKSKLLKQNYATSTSFVYWISLVQWIVLIPFMAILLAQFGVLFLVQAFL